MWTPSRWQHIGNSLRLYAKMDSHLMLNLLLPPLLFESAFAIDWHIFIKVAKYATILATLGLIVCVGLTGVMYHVLYSAHGWGWEACFLLGGILSATDPVAVVALLREMGVKKNLATLIEGESLLNDGTAMVVYSVLILSVEDGGVQRWLDNNGKDHAYILRCERRGRSNPRPGARRRSPGSATSRCPRLQSADCAFKWSAS